MHERAQRQLAEREDAPRIAPPSRHAVLALQRSAGNQAVANLLQRAPDTAQHHERKRTGQGMKVNAKLGVINDIKTARAEAWKDVATAPEKVPNWTKVLDVVIPIVALGFGGIVYGVMEQMLQSKLSHLTFEFVALASLEAGDIAAEAALRSALTDTQHAYDVGVKKAAASRKNTEPAKLAGRTDPISAYIEAVKLNLIDELDFLTDEFNDGFADSSDEALAARAAALKLTYEELKTKPEPFLRVMTTGFIHMMDVVQKGEWDKAEKGDDATERELANKERTSSGRRYGNLQVVPTDPNHSLGEWSAPDTGVKEFAASTIGLDKTTLQTLVGTPLKDLGVTLGFRFNAVDPSIKGGVARVWFSRSPDGQIVLDERSWDGVYQSGAVEWLASYAEGPGPQRGAAPRKNAAQKGAEKLLNAMMDMPIGRLGQR